MVKRKQGERAEGPSYARMTPFLRGVIYGLFLAGYTVDEIRDEVLKPDGFRPCRQSISNAIQLAEKHGGEFWD